MFDHRFCVLTTHENDTSVTDDRLKKNVIKMPMKIPGEIFEDLRTRRGDQNHQDGKTEITEKGIFYFHSVQDQIRELTGPNRDQDH